MSEQKTNVRGNPKKQGGALRQTFIDSCRDVRVLKTVKLSPNTRWILKRHFDGLSRATYLMRFYCRIGVGDEAETQISERIESAIQTAAADIDKRIATADQMLKRKAINYTVGNFEPVDVKIIDPLCFQFLGVLEQANTLEQMINALWLATVLNNKDRKQVLAEIDSTLKTVHQQARTLSIGLRDRYFAQRDRQRPGANPTAATAEPVPVESPTPIKSQQQEAA